MPGSHRIEGVGGWLLAYLAGSVPLTAICAVGLSGWFFEYPLALMAGIFFALSVPLALVPMGSPSAPGWNIALLWTMASLMAARAVNVFVAPVGGAGQPPRGDEALAVALTLLAIVSAFAGWAVVWTQYFRNSERVRKTFCLAGTRKRGR